VYFRNRYDLFFFTAHICRWRSALLWRTFFTTAVVAIVLRAGIQFCSTGKCGLFGEGGLILYDVGSAQVTYSAGDILAVIVLGTVAGILGSIYNFLVDKVVRTYSIINEYVLTLKLNISFPIYLLFSDHHVALFG
jgi:chloride channel 7